jgi:ankyrin repeat protein
MAAGAGHEQTDKALIDGGMRLETKDSSGNTALCLANKGKFCSSRSIFRYGINVDERNSKGHTALYLVAHWARTAIVENVIRNGANLNPKPKVGGIHCCTQPFIQATGILEEF